ncbi:MAG: lytic transglycosylase domain-containing protein [Blastomonas sp.]
MSSMVSRIALSALFMPMLAMPIACHAGQPSDATVQARDAGDGSEWDRARQRLLQQQPGDIAGAIERWKTLSSSGNFTFSSYASFLVTHRDWPNDMKMRQNAEQAIDMQSYSPSEVAAYFDTLPPVTNAGRARYAVVLHGLGRYDEARAMARAAWRVGTLTDDDQMRLMGLFAGDLGATDHDARMDALLWAGARQDAETQIGFASAARRPVFAARLAMMRGSGDMQDVIAAAGPSAMGDAGFVAGRATMLRNNGNSIAARELLANRPALDHPPSDPNAWYGVLLTNARAASNDSQHSLAYAIASRVDDAFAGDVDIAAQSSGIRDKYSDLMWLAGETALQKLRQPEKAIGMFDRYARSYNSPQIRSKGYYWAGRAAAEAGKAEDARQYFELAATYPDYFYGQLAHERLGRELPQFTDPALAEVDPLERGKFNASSLVQATQELARQGSDWRTQNSFFRALVDKAEDTQDYQLINELARNIGRRDLTVIAGIGARSSGIDAFKAVAFPQMPVPPGYQNNWTMIHAITRQESQFAQNAASHAGARGLMQLMPGTAREQAGKLGLSYSFGALTDDAEYNIQLGSGYFARMLDYYGGSYPLAVAAYNAGPGNVNKWLRANGDPRTGEIDILVWIEDIPIFETRNYVQRVLENAVVYDTLHPDRARYRGDNRLSFYLGKRSPG